MISPTYGNVSLEEVANLILQYYDKNKHFDSEFLLTIGSDSQTYEDTKMVVVIAIRCVGHGGIYFYEIQHVDRIMNVRYRLNFETNLSLNMANDLLKILENDERYKDLYCNMDFAIHVDVGTSQKGKTKELIPEIVGWIKSCGYDCVIKPDSYTSSSIADKISK